MVAYISAIILRNALHLARNALALCVLPCLLAPLACAAEGMMGMVTGNPGKIMVNRTVLAEVPKGALLWIFSSKPGWVEVKVPDGEKHGWMSAASIQIVKLTDQQNALFQKAAAHHFEFLKFYRKQEYAEANNSLNQCLEISRRIFGNQHPEVAGVLNNLGIVARDQGDYPTAKKYYDEALAIYKKFYGKDHLETCDMYNNLGVLYRNQGDFQGAKKSYEEALAIKLQVLGDAHSSTADTLNNLGNLVSEQADYTAARQYYERALAIYRKAHGNEHVSVANALNGLGNFASNLGDYPSARKFYEEALAIRRKGLGNKNTLTAGTLNNLGVLTRRQRDSQAAWKYHEEALAIYRKVLGNEHSDVAETLSHLGVLSGDQEDYPAAVKYFKEALAIKWKVLGNEHASTASTLNNLGIILTAQENYPAAKRSLEEALTIYRKVLGKEHPRTAETLNNLGVMAQQAGDYPAAADYYDENRRIIRHDALKLLHGLSDAEQIRFLDHNYQQHWARYLSFGWNQRDTSLSTNRSASWLINGKAVAQEMLAARALLLRDESNPQHAPLIKQLIATRQELSELALSIPIPAKAAARQEKLTQLTSDEQRLARSLAQATGTSTTEGWYELAQVRAAIPTDAIYVDLVRIGLYDIQKKTFSQPHYIAWIIFADPQAKTQIIDLGDAATIEAAIEQTRNSLASAANKEGILRNEGELAATAQATKDLQDIAKLVLQPLLPHLAGKNQLILSPDGALWLLPWAALPIAQNKCLLEQCSLRFVLSGRDLVKKEAAIKLATSAPAIFVDPNYDLTGQEAKAALKAIFPQNKFNNTEMRTIASRSSLPRVNPLPFTLQEGRAAESSLEQLVKLKPVFYEQEKALEAVVKMQQQPKHLLLSTHGFFLPDQEVKRDDKPELFASTDIKTRSVALTADGKPVENPLLRCGLLFAGCNSPREPGLDDGILTGMEIVGMDLRGTELVVLSACETGIGKVRNGEGVAGLRQAFQLAGAQSVISTLWQVPDHDSALIMQDFFANLAAGQSKAEALRTAQLKRITARRQKSGAAHPFFWAAWTVTGE